MNTRRRNRSFTLETLEDRLTLSSANASPNAIVGQAVSNAVHYLNAQPDHGDAVLDSAGFDNRGQLISTAVQTYHESIGKG